MRERINLAASRPRGLRNWLSRRRKSAAEHKACLESRTRLQKLAEMAGMGKDSRRSGEQLNNHGPPRKVRRSAQPNLAVPRCSAAKRGPLRLHGGVVPGGYIRCGISLLKIPRSQRRLPPPSGGHCLHKDYNEELKPQSTTYVVSYAF
ncbi:hypothetical protein [Acidovorax sp. FJL06]|uniref:hypothetical protein n=1 Tax=Acidovorax sp. FJL06 TaxID=2153365 RepID=UPI000F57BBE0|nr:hypothetical protein [Acidovorax sp. FJL06]